MDEAIAYIATDSPQGASRVLNAVLELAESLADLPMRGRMVPEIGEESVREAFVFSYRLIYEVFDDRVEIMWLLHGARDFERWRHGG